MSNPKKLNPDDVAYCLRVAKECGAPESSRHLAGHIEALEMELAAEREKTSRRESQIAANREAMDLINRAAERLRKEDAASTDELRAAEARGFERSREKATEEVRQEILSWVNRAPLNAALKRIRAMKDETP